MSNAGYLMNVTNGWRIKRKNIRDEYLRKLEKLEQFKGSAGYEEQKRALDKERESAMAAARSETAASMESALASMRKEASKRKTPPPKRENLELLQLLKMRESLSEDDIRHAANTMEGDPSSLAVLDDLAKKNKILGCHHNTMTDAEVSNAIRAIQKSCEALIKRDTVYDNPREEPIWGSPAYHSNIPENHLLAIHQWSVDREYSTAEEFVHRMGGASPEFLEVVK